MKKIFKFGTRAVKNTAGSIIEGIDEGFNGDDIKTLRKERREVKQAVRDNVRRQDKIVSNIWKAACIIVLVMIAKTISENGFNNQAVSHVWEDYSIALLFPFLLAGIASLLKEHF